MNVIGFPDIIPCSLDKAITEPENVIAPTTNPIDISIALMSLILSSTKILNFSGAKNAPAATKTAASPTRL